MAQAIEMKEKGGGGPPDDHGNLVAVTIDGSEKRIQARNYPVPTLKDALNVPHEKELDQVIGGVITPLADTDHVKVKGGEQFISHARTGGSS